MKKENKNDTALNGSIELTPFSLNTDLHRLAMLGEPKTAPRGCTNEVLIYDDYPFISEEAKEKFSESIGDGDHQFTPLPSGNDQVSLAELGKAISQMELINGNRRKEMFNIDSLPKLKEQLRPVNEETLVITFVQGGTSKASWHGKTLFERTAGDWADSSRMKIHRLALISAWRTKFKEKMPSDLEISVSTEGHFSSGVRTLPRNMSTKIPTGKHSGGKAQKRNKAKRRK